jgi:type II secretory pathway pseudopilin PulG
MRAQAGFTFVGLMVVVAVLGLTLAAVGVVWSTEVRREKEAQLLWVGDQYRQAIMRYRAGNGRFPLALEDLLDDKAGANPRHFIRQVYPDPLTGQADWQLVQGPDGGILGVASSSQDVPIKVANFPAQYQEFEKAKTYGDWQFVNTPRALRRHRAIRPAGSN